MHGPADEPMRLVFCINKLQLIVKQL